MRPMTDNTRKQWQKSYGDSFLKTTWWKQKDAYKILVSNEFGVLNFAKT